MADDELASGAEPRPEGSAARRRRPRWLVPVGALAVAGVVAAGAFAVAREDETDPRDAEEALAAAQAFLADAGSFAFDASQVIVITDGDPSARGGSETRERVGISGSWSADAWHATFEDATGEAEIVHADGTTYSRYSFDDEDLGQWTAGDEAPVTDAEIKDMLRGWAADLDDYAEDDPDAADAERDTLAVTLAADLHLTGTGDDKLTSDDPRSLVRLVEALDRPSAAADDEDADPDVLTLRATLEIDPEFEESFGGGLPVGVVHVDLDADDVPVAVRLSVAQGGASFDLEATFTGWGAPVTVEPPPADQVDATPWVDEEAIGSSGLPLYAPADLPAGWELWSVHLWLAEETFEECDQLNLSWSGEDGDLDAGYLELYVLPAACALDADDTPFETGRFAGFRSRDAGLLELLVGDVVVQVDTDRTGTSLRALVESLAPVDAEVVYAALATANGDTA